LAAAPSAGAEANRKPRFSISHDLAVVKYTADRIGVM
jgi:ABC-type glutathione transport system ATPase component